MRSRDVLLVGSVTIVVAAIAWAAGPTSLLVSFKLPPKINAIKPVAIVDGDGNLLFNGTTPGQVRVTNAPLPSQMVTVASSVVAYCSGSPPGSGLFAFDNTRNPDGTVSAFSIPSGSVFVITAAEAVAYGHPPDDVLFMQIHVSGSSGSTAFGTLAVTTNSEGAGGASFAIPTSGLVVASGSSLCLSSRNQNAVPSALDTVGMALHGYFAPAT
jgi:hypothetical protein